MNDPSDIRPNGRAPIPFLASSLVSLALLGMNVMALLFGGTLLAAVLGIAPGRIDARGAPDLVAIVLPRSRT